MKHRLEYLLFRVLSAGLRALPEATALRIGEGLGRFAGEILGLRRGVVLSNLERAFPDAAPEWRATVAGASWAHLGREAVAMFRMAGLEPADLVDRTEVVGLDDLRSALAEGRGVVMVTGHLGSWEMGGAALSARGIPVVAVAKPMANRLFDADLVATRERLGMEVVDTGAAPRKALRALRDNRVVGLVADQNAHADPVFVPFFGTPAATHKGPALFALRAHAAIFVGTCVRLPDEVQRYRVVLHRVDFQPEGDLERDIVRLTTAHTALLEDAVRAAPEQYFWQHKRWKTRPRPEPAPGGDVLDARPEASNGAPGHVVPEIER